MQDTYGSGEGVVGTILDRIRATAKVELVYGEERRVGEKTIIPVAAIAYAFGGGAGAGVEGSRHNGHADGGSVGGGGGGGGSVRVQPVGVLEVTEDETRMVPVLDWTRIATTAITGLAALLVVRAIFRKR